MPRQALNPDDVKIEQKPDIVLPRDTFGENAGLPERDGDVVLVDRMPDKDHLTELAFNEEPITIRLEPSTEKNAPTSYPIWVNGKGAEVYQNGRWDEIAYLPVGKVITTRRKYVDVMIRAKFDAITTDVSDPESENPRNAIRRFTSAVHSFSVIEDRNPRGVAWLSEMRRRNL